MSDEMRNGPRILVVEDEPLVAMLMENMLADLGYGSTTVAMHLNEAMMAAKTELFDMAVLDVNIDGEFVFPVADVLASRAIPFLFATGQGKKDIPERYRGRPLLTKPFPAEQLAESLEGLRH